MEQSAQSQKLGAVAPRASLWRRRWGGTSEEEEALALSWHQALRVSTKFILRYPKRCLANILWLKYFCQSLLGKAIMVTFSSLKEWGCKSEAGIFSLK